MAVATVTFVVANLLGSGGSKVKAVSAEAAFAALEEKPNAFLLDIRRRKEASADGTPDIRSTGRKVETLAFSQVWLCFISHCDLINMPRFWRRQSSLFQLHTTAQTT